MLWLDLVFGLGIAASGAVRELPLFCGALFVAMICGALFQSCGQTLWQRKVPLGLQGRLFAFTGMLMNSSMPVAASAGGMLANHLFEPWPSNTGWLAYSVGVLTGTGTGRGIGVMFVLAGLLTAALAIAALLRPTLRRLDVDLPDAH